MLKQEFVVVKGIENWSRGTHSSLKESSIKEKDHKEIVYSYVDDEAGAIGESKVKVRMPFAVTFYKFEGFKKMFASFFDDQIL